MAIKNFIPTIWSENLYTELDKQYIAVKHCNREFEGDIKNCGSIVKICGVGDISVFDYNKNSDLSAPEALSDTANSLVIDQAKCFNFQIDDIDRAQSVPGLMNAAMKVAANALANAADVYVYSLCEGADHVVYNAAPTPENIIDTLLEARKVLYKNNVTDNNDVIFEVSPDVAEIIIKAKIALATDNTETLENGCIGSVAGCKIFVSNNIAKSKEDGICSHLCLARTKRAIAFAEQLSEINAYRPEKRFADAVKGLHLYGAKIVYPNEIVNVTVNFPMEEYEDESGDEYGDD